MSRSGDLYELQTIDTSLDQYRKRLSEITANLSDKTAVRSAEVSFILAEEALKKGSTELKEAEQKVRDQRLKIKTTDAKLYGGKISNPKELKDLQDESEALRRYLNVLEDRQLECMLQVDDVLARHSKAKEKLAEIKEKTKRLHQEWIAEKETIEGEVKALENRRQSTIILIPSEDQVRYENLRNKGHGLAVAKVKNGSCSACGAILTAALNQAARSPNQITLCDTCGRILVS